MNKIIIILIIILVFLFLLKGAVFDNIDSLCVLASASGQPSTLHDFFMDRIYKIAEKKDISNILIDHLRRDNKQALHGLYLRILGVIGARKALNDFMLVYYKHQDEKRSLKLYYVLNYIGLLGEEKVVIFLETILNKEGQWELLNYPIARSLYLLTGRKYNFFSSRNEMPEFYPTDEVLHARGVILATKYRKRTFQEMIILDRLFRK